MTDYPIIAISGPPGSGKSTLVGQLRQHFSFNCVYFDAHETMTDQSVDAIECWIGRGMPLAEMLPPDLIAHLSAARKTAPVLFETPLGRAPAAHSTLITLSVWLDCPLDIALARKIAIAVQPDNGLPAADLGAWLEGYLQAYPRIIAPCLAMQHAQVRPLAEVILDATQPIQQTLSALIRLITPLTATDYSA